MNIDENNCPIRATLDVIGGKWKPVILYYLKTEGALRYGELQRFIPHISKKVLTEQLRELEKDRIIIRKDYDMMPPHVEYSITEYGATLRPILQAMAEWGSSRLGNRSGT